MVIEACLQSAERASRGGYPGGGVLTDDVLTQQLVPAVAEALDAAAMVAPVFTALGGGGGSGGCSGGNGGYGGYAKNSKKTAADGIGDVMAAAANVLKTVVVAVGNRSGLGGSPAAAAALSSALHLALVGYRRDPVANAALLSVIISVGSCEFAPPRRLTLYRCR